MQYIYNYTYIHYYTCHRGLNLEVIGVAGKNRSPRDPELVDVPNQKRSVPSNPGHWRPLPNRIIYRVRLTQVNSPAPPTLWRQRAFAVWQGREQRCLLAPIMFFVSLYLIGTKDHKILIGPTTCATFWDLAPGTPTINGCVPQKASH